MKNVRFNKYTNTAIKAAKAGGKILLDYFNSGLSVKYKGRIDPVTIADKTSQKEIVEIIKEEFSGHSIIGEEDRIKKGCSDDCWIVDPLDGTVNYIHGVPFFCVSIGYIHKGQKVSGVVYAPCLKEMFVAEKGRGAYLNGTRINVSAREKMVRSLIVTGFPYDVHSDRKNVMNSLSRVIENAQGVRRMGSAALDLAYVAAGRFEAFWERGLKPWDVAGGSIIVEESGGRVTEYDGGGNYIFSGTLIASNGLVHEEMMRLVR